MVDERDDWQDIAKGFLDGYASMQAQHKEAEDAKKQPRRWRDGKGVVHALTPWIHISMSTGLSTIGNWVLACGRTRRSTVEHEPTLTVTCLKCLTIGVA